MSDKPPDEISLSRALKRRELTDCVVPQHIADEINAISEHMRRLITPTLDGNSEVNYADYLREIGGEVSGKGTG